MGIAVYKFLIFFSSNYKLEKYIANSLYDATRNCQIRGTGDSRKRTAEPPMAITIEPCTF